MTLRTITFLTMQSKKPLRISKPGNSFYKDSVKLFRTDRWMKLYI